jgi:hypothetical protein
MAFDNLVGCLRDDRPDAAALRLRVRQHVTPEVRRGGIAVQEHDGVTLTHLRARHLAVDDPHSQFCRRMQIGGDMYCALAIEVLH